MTLTLEQCERNLKSAHLGCEDDVILLLTSRGDPESKRNLLDKWIREYNFKPNELTKLLFLQNHEYVGLAGFNETFLWLQQYVIIRLCSNYSLPGRPEQLELGLTGIPRQKMTTQLNLKLRICDYDRGAGIRLVGSEKNELDSCILWDRFRAHPFSKPYLFLSDQKQ